MWQEKCDHGWIDDFSKTEGRLTLESNTSLDSLALIHQLEYQSSEDKNHITSLPGTQEWSVLHTMDITVVGGCCF